MSPHIPSMGFIRHEYVWICSVPDCEKRTPRTSCRVCGFKGCKTHATPQYHPCLRLSPKQRSIAARHREMADVHGLVAQVAASDVAMRALALRPSSQSCELDLPELIEGKDHHWLTGGMNLNIPLVFDDGTKWYFRKRLETIECRTPWNDVLTTSEIATMQTLQTIVPQWTPKVWQIKGVGFERAKPPDGVFVEHVAGTVMWAKGPKNHIVSVGDLAKFFVQLSNTAFEGIGSLHLDDKGKSVVGPLVDLSCTRFPTLPGPFATLQDKYLAQIDHTLDDIEAGLVFSFAQVERYLLFLELRSLVERCEEMATRGPTYLKHGDDEAHIMVLEDGHLSGIIDWEFSYTTSFEDAFATPLHLTYGEEGRADNNTLTVLEQALHDEYLRLDRPDMARAVRGSRKYHCTQQLIVGQVPVNIGALRDLHAAFYGSSSDYPSTMEEWESMVKHKNVQNEGMQRMLVKHAQTL